MMKIIFKISILVIVLWCTACDIVEKPYIESSNDNCGDADGPVPIRQIVVEKYTGHKCGNCPEGDEKMHELIDRYCDHVIPVSIHAGYFAQPDLTGKYTYDYTTYEGDELDEYFGSSNAGLPNAIINRTEFDGKKILSPFEWSAAVEDFLHQPPEADIHITAGVPEGSRKLSTEVQVTFLKEFTENIRLTVYLLEDSILTWQKDYTADPPDIKNYTHNHVLRAALNSTWGELLTNAADKGDVMSKNFEYRVSEHIQIEYCQIVAFISKDSSDEIIQAASEKVYYND